MDAFESSVNNIKIVQNSGKKSVLPPRQVEKTAADPFLHLSKKLPLPKALFTQDILTHNISIKRYCDKNIFLRHGSL